jgi:hypothetical protein
MTLQRASAPVASERGALLALLLALAVPRGARAQADAGAVVAHAVGAGAGEALAQGREALDRGDLAAARAQFEAASRATEPRVAAQAFFLLGEVSERQLRFPDAVAAYRASLERDPGGRYAARALARIEFLQEHAEGGFAPLVALERVRSDPARASDPAAIAELARAAREFPPGPVRAEARLLVAQAYAGRLDRPREAVPVLRELATDPGASVDMRRLATQLLAQVRERTGELDLAVAELRELGADAATLARFERLVRRRTLHKVALGSTALVALAGALAVVRALRAGRGRELLRVWLRPLPLAHIAMLSIGGGLLAHTYDEGGLSHLGPFFGLGVGTLAMYLAAAAWSLVGSARAAARAGRAVACAAAMLAVSFLAMHHYDPGMLDGIGL